MSIAAGLHVPPMPFIDVDVSVGTAAPLQIIKFVPKLNDGVMFGSTVSVNVAVVAHGPAAGVNV